MAKVTSKLQVTIPKHLAEKCGIRPGDNIEWSSSGQTIRLIRKQVSALRDTKSRLELFDAATERQRQREAKASRTQSEDSDRGWSREDLYERGEPR